ncbi:MAG TPA: amino acid adenylation domain-containing protein, partial [Chitinophagaceae bacterium]|nr:amino acid adenylation domain-containing protein [Chitinophagaceae bacterium]
MRIDEYITSLRKEHNIIVTSDNGELKIKAKQGSLTSEIVDDIRSRKPQIIDFFRTIGDSRQMQAIPPAPPKSWYRLSAAQRRLYFMYELDRSSLAYNMPMTVKLQGLIDKEKISNIFSKLVQRHESLRTSFEVVNGEPVQKIAAHVDFVVEPCSTTGGFVRPFNLAKAPLMRAGLAEISANEVILMVDMHHIITDGVSIGILMKEFMLLYNNEELPAVKLQYKDFSEWQQSPEQQEWIAAQKNFWKNEFAEEVSLLELPADLDRPSNKTYAGSAIDFELDAGITARLKWLAEKENCTLFMLLLSAYSILLSRLSNQDDVVVGSSLAGRNHADLDHTIGMFVNTIPLRNYPKGELRFREFLADLRSRTLDCFRNQSYTYSELIDELKIQRTAGRNPFFDVMFDLQNFMDTEIKIPGLVLSPCAAGHAISKFDLTLTAMEAGDQLKLHLEYSTELFRKETAERFIAYFTRIIAAIIDNPGQQIKDIQLIDAAERKQLLHDFNDTALAYDGRETVLSLFNRQVALNPDSSAVVVENRTLTYRQLDELSNQLANCLRSAHNIQTGETVGIQLDRNEWMIVSILGVLKSGGAYVPIDPAYPAERKKHIVTDAGVRLLITETYYLFELDYFNGAMVAVDVELGMYPSDLDAPEVKPAGLAYVIYTSGSTGKPKGVMIEHGSLYNYINWARDQYVRGEKGDFALYTSIAFDLTITSIFTPLVTGNSIIVYKEYEKDLAIEKVLADNKADIIKLTPSHLKVMRNSKYLSSFTGKKKLIVGGEQLETWLARDIHQLLGDVEIYNEYGPTEATVGCMIYHFVPGSNAPVVPIGVPAANTQIYVLDKHLNPVPKGVGGELYIGGACVARGYINNETLTKERFINDPFHAGQRLYRTGDRARMLADGNLEFLGRTDEQVKIRGHRIEPGEIASQLCQHENITQCAVIVKQKDGTSSLVAYYVSERKIEAENLQSFLAASLPEYMVPAAFVHLHELPLTINGKLDKRALPQPEAEQDNYIAPADEKEQLLAEIWSKVLGLERVGTNDNFFLLGGDSIKSIQISSRLLGEGYDVPVKDIFTHKTIRELAPRLKAVTSAPVQLPITGSAPLTPIQRWYFESAVVDPHYFNHSVLLRFDEGITEQTIRLIFEKILEHHDALRMVFRKENETIVQHNPNVDQPLWMRVHDLSTDADAEKTMEMACNEIQRSIDLENGPLLKLGLFHLGSGSRLLIVIHHLVVDGVSWRILFEDIETLYRQCMQHEPLALPPKTDAYLSWSSYLQEHTKTHAFEKAMRYWKSEEAKPSGGIRPDLKGGENTVGISRSVSFRLNTEETAKLLTTVHEPFNTQINDILLTAFLMAVHAQYGSETLMVNLESHGRTGMGGLNVSRTIGWFTTIYPVKLNKRTDELSLLIRQVKEVLRGVPNNGLDYLLMGGRTSQICFNYLGQFDSFAGNSSYSMAKESRGQQVSQNKIRDFEWDVIGIVAGGELEMSLTYSPLQYCNQTIENLLQHFKAGLLQLIEYCCAYDKKLLSPSDLAYKDISIERLDVLQQQYELENIYSLSPMQEGILFHSLFDPSSNNYFEQLTYSVKGRLDLGCIEKSMDAVIARYDVLRACFLYEGAGKPLQLVLKNKPGELIYKDIRSECMDGGQAAIIQRYQEADKANKFNLATGALMRLTVLQVAEHEYEFIWSHHHILMDGWCMQIIINEFSTLYAKYRNGRQVELPGVIPYAQYIHWLEERDDEASKAY